MVMIDWVTATIPYYWDKPINDGRVEKIDPTGGLISTNDSFLRLVGSYEASVQVLSGVTREGQKVLYVSGNPSKFLQGHNLFGSGDLVGLLGEFFVKIADIRGHKISNAEFASWTTGDYNLSRVDVNEMYSMGSRLAVREMCETITSRLILRRVGQGSNDCSTVYLEPKRIKRKRPAAKKQAPRWVGRVYGKADEMALNYVPLNLEAWEKKKDKTWGGHLPDDIMHRDALCAWADDKIRIERQLNRKFLSENDLSRGSAWRVKSQPNDHVAQGLIDDLVCKVRYYDGSFIDPVKVEALPKRLQIPLMLWRHGENLARAYSEPTFLKMVKEFREFLDLDIHIRSNGVKTKKIAASVPWSFEPCQPPSFAFGTKLLAAGFSSDIDTAARDAFFGDEK